MCNCCGCCCGILRGVTEWGLETPWLGPTTGRVDDELCTGCGVCVERCQVGAVSMSGGIAVVDRAAVSAAACASPACSADAMVLEKRADWEAMAPPETFAEWEHQRLHHRGTEPGGDQSAD